MVDPIRFAKEVPGWMTHGELLWLARMAAEANVIVEIGSWKGRSTTALVSNTRGRVYAVDHWRGSDPEHLAEIEARGVDSVFEDFKSYVAPWSGQIIALRMDSDQAVSIIEQREKKVDFVFVDANHTEEGCGQDIDLYRGLVREGGIISGHDYGNPQFPGVTKAVNDRFKTVNRDDLSIWWTRL